MNLTEFFLNFILGVLVALGVPIVANLFRCEKLLSKILEELRKK